MRLSPALAAVAVSAMLAACGHSSPSGHSSSAPPSAAPTSAAKPAGCQQTTLLVAAISSHLQQSPGDTERALHQLSALGKGLPDGMLKVDVDRAALDIALFRQYVLLGGPAARAAKRFAADLTRIQAYCA